MSISNKSDVKNHLSLRFRARTYLNVPAGAPDAGGYPLSKPDPVGTSPSPFAKDYSADHSIAGIPSAPNANPIGSTDSQEPETPKSAQA